MLSSSTSLTNRTRLAGPSSAKRTFPPLYTSKGDVQSDRLAFVHVLGRLKTQKRTGWINHNIPNPESISDHMYRMALLALSSDGDGVDVTKCVLMCLVHDLAEAHVGDIAPNEGIPKAEKYRLEKEAMQNFTGEMLHESTAARRIYDLWEEYEAGETPEAKFVKDLDRFEMAAQASEYERVNSAAMLQPFFTGSIPYIRHPEIKMLGKKLFAERQEHMENDFEPTLTSQQT